LVLIVMGVTGAGKTTVGKVVAQKLGWKFADADEFHSPSNIQKMSRGAPLDDADRAPWLRSMHDAIVQWNTSGQNVVLACSALKQAYRHQLRDHNVKFVYLKGQRELILSRLNDRHGHFATASILDGQFRDLEEPRDAITVTISGPPEQIAATIIERLSQELAASSKNKK